MIGIGKGSVTLEDVHQAELIMVMGQNPGTNHPRMLSALEIAKKNGAKIIAVNPLKETGLLRFRNPQTPRGVVGPGTGLADLYLQIRGGGDLALLQAISSLLLEWGCVDRDFVEKHTVDFEPWARSLEALDWDEVLASTGLSRSEIEQAARMFAESSRSITCWAMGITQHRNAVATVKEIVNLHLLQGNIGKPGAGLCPVRGHSNVQGDRTMGIWERVPDHFLDTLRDEFGFEPPREHGLDSVASIKALRDGDARVFVGLGGNFVSAAPDTSVTEEAMRSAALTVHVSTKLNRSHVVHGREALILPALGRSREGPDRRQAAEGVGRGLHVLGAHLAGAAQAGLAPPPVGGRHHLLDRRGHARGRRPDPVERVPRRLHDDPPLHREGRARVRGVPREGEPAGRLRAAAPPARRAGLPDRARRGDLLREPDRGAAGAARPPR